MIDIINSRVGQCNCPSGGWGGPDIHEAGGEQLRVHFFVVIAEQKLWAGDADWLKVAGLVKETKNTC